MSRRFPAEWELHKATWLAWPHCESDWPGLLDQVKQVYLKLISVLSASEKVRVICRSPEEKVFLDELLLGKGISNFELHVLPTDRSWLRDSAPTAVISEGGEIEWISWKFNAWAKYQNYSLDQKVPELIAEVSGHPLTFAKRADNDELLVLEGGAIDIDGEGTLLVTEQCLLSEVQQRNPGLTKEGYEKAFAEYLGVKKILWLPTGYAGDDTHGHIDDVARFVAPGKIILSYTEDSNHPDFEAAKLNHQYLESQTDALGRALEVIKLPIPDPIYFEEEILPASYANFYIANKVVLLPVFNDLKDREAIEILEACFPERQVCPIDARDFIVGLGTFHCSTQQEPLVG